MPNVLFCADLHIDHRKICLYRDEFSNYTVEEHNEIIVDNLNYRVRKNDTLYILGDCFFGQRGLQYFLKHIRCTNIHVVLGNHDRSGEVKEMAKHFKLHGPMRYKKFFLSHVPVRPECIRGRMNIHGHVHYHNINDPRYLNISLENTGYYPVSLDEIKNHVDSHLFDPLQSIKIHL